MSADRSRDELAKKGGCDVVATWLRADVVQPVNSCVGHLARKIQMLDSCKLISASCDWALASLGS